MNQPFKLFPTDPTTDTKIYVVKDTHDPSQPQLTINSWRRILPNKTSIPIPIDSRQPIAYQCSPLDNNCTIEVNITYKMYEKVYNKCLSTNFVYLVKQLKERTLYVLDPLPCRVSVDEFCVPMTVFVNIQKKKIRFNSDCGKYQFGINQYMVQFQPMHSISKLNLTNININNNTIPNIKQQFLKFYTDSLKFTPKFKNSFCYLIFNSKLQQDLFLFQVSQTYKQLQTKNNNQIKLVGIGSTPRNQKQKDTQRQRQLKNDRSSSSLRQHNKIKNKSRTKTQYNITNNTQTATGQKQKIRITEQIHRKKSCSKVNSNTSSNANVNININASFNANSSTNNSKINLNLTSTRECLNIFQQEQLLQFQFQKDGEQPSTAKQSDLSMDLRGSFEQLQQKSTVNKDDDNISDHSFKQKTKSKLGPIDQQNRKLRQQNARLKRQMQSMQAAVKEAAVVKKKYLNAVKQLERLESQRIALVRDKVRYQAQCFDERNQKERLRKQLEKFVGPLSTTGTGLKFNR